ncbi:ExbD/TolR family protein [Ovoidimarina sediminis]|uniref:ExbD/TolR family protein n=1 Tax=Ovoidimarina sediminis TaxID=3079856 RepID=UPI0029124E29|nr:biopolymer transporter ExbD [Rhodophyticola sp. MJ-SS7]MDU8945145.1 biopolymer transporter ExbD [Rhodophyticola sp. MJ-SS7]
MRFVPASRRRPVREAVVPMINVVFLLLIFFLMSAVIAAPPPLDVSLPASEAGGDGRAPGDGLTIDAGGTMAFGDLRGDAALDAAVTASGEGVLDLRADAGLEAVKLARLLVRLAEAGVLETRLLTVTP